MMADEKIKNSNELEFAVFCIENVAAKLGVDTERVIECFAKQQGLSLDEALGLFYHSEVYQLMRDGVSDMHCMSELYLAEELRLEYTEKVLENCQ